MSFLLRLQSSWACGLALLMTSGALLAKPAPAAKSAPHAAAAAPAAAPAPPEAPSAPAAPPPLTESLTGMAKADYAAARILYDDGDFQDALVKLKSAYEASKDPRLLWNMAACEKNLRHYAEVVRLVDRYLSEGVNYVTDSDKAEATSLVETVKAFVTDLTVEANEAGAMVYFDDQPLGATPLPSAARVDMGAHKIRVSKAGFVDFSANQDLPGGQAVKVTVELKPERHEGTLRVLADAQDVVQVDGKAAGTGVWEGVLPSGTHAVFVTAKGKLSHQTDVVITDNETSTLHVSLQDEPKQSLLIEKSSVPTWVWIAGGAVLVGGGVSAYFLLKPGSKYETPTEGNWGAISL